MIDFTKIGFTTFAIIKDGKLETGIQFPSDMDQEEWNVVKNGVTHWLNSEEQIEQIRKDRQVRLGLDLMERLKN